MKQYYMNYKTYSFRYDPAKLTFQCSYRTLNSVFLEGRVIADAEADITSAEPVFTKKNTRDTLCYTFQYACGISLSFHLSDHEASIRFSGPVRLKGILHWGENPAENTFAGLYDPKSPVLHAGSGPVTRAGDDMLFDRQNDTLLHFIPSGEFTLDFDWTQKAYAFCAGSGNEAEESELRIQIKENYMAQSFNIPYHPIDKRGWFTTPPVSWMTWYACGTADYDPTGRAVDNGITFEACEAEVLENTRQMKKQLGPYCKDLVTWVDWEWDHSNFTGKNDSCDALTPRSDAFPHGMKYVSEQIEAMGCIPAIWTGMTCDGRLNKWYQAHRECVLGPDPLWCGQWFLDPGYPEVFEEYVPMVMKQLLDWGYKAVKWDCIYSLHEIWDKHYDELKEPRLDYWTAMRKFAEAGRKALGNDIFFLYCNMSSDSHISSGAGYVNSARIGSDVFKWNEFLDSAVERLFHCYPIHNTVMYADCDNIVLRKQFNTLEQVRSRVSFYGLTGVPLTLGDRFREYDPERLDMLRRIVPVVDMHPVELQAKKGAGQARIIVSSFSRDFGKWQVAAVMNTSEEPLNITLDFASDCRLACKGERYAVYDYWNRKFLGVFDRSVPLTIAAHDTAVLRITPLEEDGLPLLISSSRHLTQGGFELAEIHKDIAGKKISGTVQCIGGETEQLTFLLPDDTEPEVSGGSWTQNGRCGILSVTVPDNQAVKWSLMQKKPSKNS